MGYPENTFQKWGEEGCFPKLEAHTPYDFWLGFILQGLYSEICYTGFAVIWYSSKDHYQERNEQGAVWYVEK